MIPHRYVTNLVLVKGREIAGSNGAGILLKKNPASTWQGSSGVFFSGRPEK
jgi:lipid-binding SYLF domain-containing protein